MPTDFSPVAACFASEAGLNIFDGVILYEDPGSTGGAFVMERLTGSLLQKSIDFLVLSLVALFLTKGGGGLMRTDDLVRV